MEAEGALDSFPTVEKKMFPMTAYSRGKIQQPKLPRSDCGLNPHRLVQLSSVFLEELCYSFIAIKFCTGEGDGREGTGASLVQMGVGARPLP